MSRRSAEQRVPKARGSRRRSRRGGGVLGCPHPQPTRGVRERRDLPQRGPGRSPGSQRILGIFHGLSSLLVETMHGVYGIVKC